MNGSDHDLLSHAQLLIGLTSPREILNLLCRAARPLCGQATVFASSASSGTWASGIHVRLRDELGQPDPAELSALFAVHRALAHQRAPLAIDPAGRPVVVDALCGPGGPERVVHAIPIVHRRGRLCGTLAVCAPLSEHTRGVVLELASMTARALEGAQRFAFARRDQDRLNLLAEAAEEALWDWNPTSGEFWWGGGVQHLIGGVVIQSRLSWKFEQVHPADQERVRASFERFLAAPNLGSWREEYRHRRGNGSWMIVEDRAIALRDPDGRAHRVLGSLRDVTELRDLLAREQQARAEAERASRAKDEFLAMLGHELRNPLAPILTALHLLRHRSGPEIEKERTVIERQARHLTRLVDDLLDVSRIAKGKVVLQRERLDLADVVGMALETAGPLVEERRHRVEVEVERGLMVEADRARMAQVLGNVLNNAAKYTEPGGTIRVSGRVSGGSAEVRVRDTGVGISAEMLPRVFELFVQEHQASDRGRGGLGLGLSIVRNLVELHGGSVEVRSEGRGRGTEVAVRIPALEGARAASSPIATTATAERLPAGRRRILIVDDNRDAAELLAEALAELGHETRVVHDGAAALLLAEELDPEVVLLDIGLPVIDGYEVARRLRQRRGPDRLRLIALTGYGQEADRKRTREASFDAHLVKPVTLERVQEAICGA